MQEILHNKDAVITAARELISFLTKCVPDQIEFKCTDIGAAGLAERLNALGNAFKTLDGE